MSGAAYRGRGEHGGLTEYRNGSPGIDARKLQYHCDVGGYIVGDIAHRLAAYEDTGLEPGDIAALVKARDEGPCVLCRYNPPSSCDGKPCTMCPAVGITRAEAEAAFGGGGDG